MTNEIKLTLRKTNSGELGTYSRNNCRTNGKTTWFVLEDETGLVYFESRRKKECSEILDWVNSGNWDGKGDLQMSFDCQ